MTTEKQERDGMHGNDLENRRIGDWSADPKGNSRGVKRRKKMNHSQAEGSSRRGRPRWAGKGDRGSGDNTNSDPWQRGDERNHKTPA